MQHAIYNPHRSSKPLPDLSAAPEYMDKWDHLATVAHKSPTAVGIATGLLYVASTIKKGDRVTAPKFLAGVVIACILGYAVNFWLKECGVSEGTRLLVAIATGVACDSALGIIVARAMQVAGGRVDETK